MKVYEAIRVIVIAAMAIGGYFLVVEILSIWNEQDQERFWNQCLENVTSEGISEQKAADICVKFLH